MMTASLGSITGTSPPRRRTPSTLVTELIPSCLQAGNAALLDNGDCRLEELSEFGIVADHEDRGPGLAQLEEEVHHARAAGRIEAVEHLVEQEQIDRRVLARCHE